VTYRDEWKKELPGHGELRELHERLRADVQTRWKRSLPYADELFDRWERASFLGFGEGSSVYDAALIIGDIEVGEHTWIGPFTVLDGSGGLSIGSHCSISSAVQIYSHDTVARSLTGGKAPARTAPVRIGDRCYIGPQAIISAGVTIGNECVIGAGALVKNDIPDRSIAFGTPARISGRVEIDGANVKLCYDSEA